MAARGSTADAMGMLLQNPAVPTHTISLIVIEPSVRLSHQQIQRLLGSALPQLARFRSRLVSKPLGGRPLWAEIDDFDPTSQIHSATIDSPGGPRELSNFIAQLGAEPGGRPDALWQAWSIDGLAGDRWALAIKMSPALNDGRAGVASVWSRLLRSGPHYEPARAKLIQPSLGTLRPGERMIDTMGELAESYFNGFWSLAAAASYGLQSASRQFSGTSEFDPMPPAASSMRGPLPDNAFNATLTKRRAIAFASISLADLKSISHAFGGTVVNVFLAACTLALRAWLLSHDAVPDHPLVIQMPFTLLGTSWTPSGNPLVSGRIRLPVQLDDPVQVLINLHTAAERLNHARTRDSEHAGPGLELTRIAALLPPSVVRAGWRLYAASGIRQRHAASCHGSFSWVSAEPVPVYCAGAKVIGMHSVSPLRNDCGLNIALTARGDVMDLSVCVCPDNVPAVNDIATGIAESVDVLLEAAGKSPRGQGRSVVTQMKPHSARHVHTWRA
jgi:diacylglycerol O-acyltransferase / wax synthase